MRLILVWLVTAALVMLGAYYLPGFSVDSFLVALIVAIVLGLINLVIKPLILLITLPVNILTLGLFTFVINALLLQLAAVIVPGFSAENFLSSLLVAILIAVGTSLVADTK